MNGVGPAMATARRSVRAHPIPCPCGQRYPSRAASWDKGLPRHHPAARRNRSAIAGHAEGATIRRTLGKRCARMARVRTDGLRIRARSDALPVRPRRPGDAVMQVRGRDTGVGDDRETPSTLGWSRWRTPRACRRARRSRRRGRCGRPWFPSPAAGGPSVPEASCHPAPGRRRRRSRCLSNCQSG